jgi:hypothetical protein
MKLKKHGAIDIRIEALGDEDAVIVIRPEILTLVLEQNVRAAQAAFEAHADGATKNIESASPLEQSGGATNELSADARSAQIIPLERPERGPTSRARPEG